MNLRYRVELDQSEPEAALAAMLSGGKHAARELKQAQFLLAAHAGQDDASIAATVAVGESTVYRTKRRSVETGLEAQPACGSIDRLNSTTPPSTPVGSTWSRSKSACCEAGAWIPASIAAIGLSPRSWLGSNCETPAALTSTGCSLPKRHGKNGRSLPCTEL